MTEVGQRIIKGAQEARGIARFGRAKFTTIYRDVNRLREAIRSHDALATEEAWEKVERWLPAIMGGAIDRGK